MPSEVQHYNMKSNALPHVKNLREEKLLQYLGQAASIDKKQTYIIT